MIRCSELSVAPDLSLYHAGPPLDQGEKAALFYFALSGPDSLCLDPFNQPVQFLLSDSIRIFSLTLPGHEAHLPAKEALQLWAQDIHRGVDCIGRFLDDAERAIEFCFQKKLITPGKLAAAGLSRGGLIAIHLAARDPRIHAWLGFAPVTQLGLAKEFHSIQHHPIIQNLDTRRTAKQLYSKPGRIYIGNRDHRVSTRACFDFVESVSDAAAEHRKSAPLDLIIGPSIGHLGHGTSPEVFRKGADWIAEILKI